MGKKAKIGKQRRDKFYQLAKETGFRSRAAFKLLQLNRKHEFLQKSRVLIDLCAAPGGWLQVASQNTPVSSIIIGVDLVPIKPVHRVTTIQEDITSPRCRQLLKKELQTWRADCVLHDGAPNVGKNWIHDAFQQSQLTLSALKLATAFLRQGGWFITKVFRSKDYNSLLWVFQQLFKKVFATKPQASRSESSEIFVVCQGYLAPDKLDPKFLDPKYVFAEVDQISSVKKLDLGRPDGRVKKKAEGYPDEQNILFHKVPVSQFIREKHHLETLDTCNEIEFDDDEIANHPLTTAEIKECCKDIKVLGRKEMKLLITWRKNLRKLLCSEDEDKTEIQEEDEEDEDEKVEKEIAELKMEELREMKIKKKKILRERRKLREKMNLKMVLTKDEPIVVHDSSLFRLSVIQNETQLNEVAEKNVAVLDEHLNDEDEEQQQPSLPRYKRYQRDEPIPELDDWDGISEEEYSSSDEKDLGSMKKDSTIHRYPEGDSDTNDENLESEMNEGHPLLTDLDYSAPQEKSLRKMEAWFSKPMFEGLEDDDGVEDHSGAKNILNKNSLKGKANEDKNIAKEKMSGTQNVDSNLEEDDSGDDDDNDVDNDEGNTGVSHPRKKSKSSSKNLKQDGFEIVPLTNPVKRKDMTLDVEGLALGAMMIQSKKMKRDILESAWNRYTNNDENLPSWFVKEEERHNCKQLPVTKELIAEYRQRLQEINARPIKKVVDAKARKKRRLKKRMEKARKKAESVMESANMTDHEKTEQIKAIYKKAAADTKQNEKVTYVVSKKGLAGKRVARPRGVTGRYRVVDPRMKKDDKKRKSMERMVRNKRLPKSKLTVLKRKLARPKVKNNKRKK